MDLGEQLLDTWRINGRITLFLLEALTPEQLVAPLGKGKAVAAQFAHIHNVRLMWLKASAPDLHEPQSKLEPTATKDELAAGLAASAEAIEELTRRGLEEGRVKNFKPHPSAFVGYMVAHEANHRAQVEVALRQAGTPLSDKVCYAMWEWGVR
jgi:uncharacterized damage-inducible protein DinB